MGATLASLLAILVVVLESLSLCNGVDARVVARAADSCSLPEFPANAPNSTYQPSPGNAGTDESTEWDEPTTNPAGRAALRRRGVTKEDWMTAIDDGKSLWRRLQNVLQDRQSKDIQVCNLNDRWDVGQLRGPLLTSKNDWLEPRPPPWVTWQRPSKPEFYQGRITAPKGRQNDPAYFHEMEWSPSAGVIKAVHIKGIKWDGTERAPDRWSDVTWAFWKRLCEEKGKDPASLTWIAQMDIRNGKTNSLMDEIINNQIGTPSPFDDGDDSQNRIDGVLKPGDDAFYALLATPNVIGTVYMLMNYTNAIGRKTISEISYFRLSPRFGYHLYIKVENVPSTPPGDTVATT